MHLRWYKFYVGNHSNCLELLCHKIFLTLDQGIRRIAQRTSQKDLALPNYASVIFFSQTLVITLFSLSGQFWYIHSLQVHFHPWFGIHWGKGWSTKISPLQRLNIKINVQSAQKPQITHLCLVGLFSVFFCRWLGCSNYFEFGLLGLISFKRKMK